MAPKTSFSVSRQPSTGLPVPKRSCDLEVREESRLGDSKPQPKSSQLDDGKNEQPKLKLYNLKFEQQKIITIF